MFGHYLKKYPIKLPLSIIFTIIGFAITFGGTAYFTIKNGSLYTLFIDGMTIGCFFLGTGIFCLCENAKDLINRPVQKITEYISKASFCIYLVDMFVLYEMEDLKFSAGTLPIPMLCSIPIVVLVCFAVSTGIYFILSHIPVVKKWLI